MVVHKTVPGMPTGIVSTIAALHAASWKAAYRGLFSDRYLDHEVDADRRVYWKKRLRQLTDANGRGQIFLATVGGKAAGFLCMDVITEPEWGAYVDNLHVLPAWRGANIGGMLLARGTDWAHKHERNQLYLWVYEKNHAARRFYRRDGWHVAERKREPVPGGGSRMVLRMVKSI
jgi:GNAT superfamily N-acetyltransferase